MQIPSDQRFYLESADQLESEIHRLQLALPLDKDATSLGQGMALGGRLIVNRFCARAMEGGDAEAPGGPSALTLHRYVRLARGGYGLICTEPTAVDPRCRRDPHQLFLSGQTAPAFATWVDAMRAASAEEGHEPALLFLNLDDAGMATGDVAAATACYVEAARTAGVAGFDGVEIRCESDVALADIEAASNGAAADPARFDTVQLRIDDVVQAVRAACPALLVAVRLRAYTARNQPLGFGTDPADYRVFDPTFPARLVRRLKDRGVCLLDMTANHPALRGGLGSAASRNPVLPGGYPHEHPLAALERVIAIAGALRDAASGMVVAAGGFSWLRQFMPAVASGAIRDGFLDIVALDRYALAYPDAPADWSALHRLDPYRCCIQCDACGELLRAGSRSGCVLQDRDVYGPAYRGRHDAERLMEEARRCHRCNPAPCQRSTPGALDIPGFMRAYACGDIQRAGRLLRAQQVLPEMCAELAPYSASGERDCIETVLHGTAVAIRDLQYSAAYRTRADGMAAIRLPPRATGRRVMVAGGGPAGIAAAATLLEHGHSVTLLERSGMLGGVPERLIPATRFGGSQAEIDVLLEPARRAGRLDVCLNTALGTDVSVKDASRGSDALLLAVGLWKEHTLGSGNGIYSGLDFLERRKAGPRTVIRGTAVVLAGGDCAMDSACLLKADGADPLVILFGGSRSEMHWCMEEAWFAQPGVHARMLCRPVGYQLDMHGCVTGVRVIPMEPETGGGAHDLAGGEFIVAADMVVEAMGLTVADDVRAAFPSLSFGEDGLLLGTGPGACHTGMDGVFAAGALVNGGASVPQCVEEGIRVAGEIHNWLTRSGSS